MKVLRIALLAALPLCAEWRTGYYSTGGSQTLAQVPWAMYTHVVHFAFQPKLRTGTCSLDGSYYQISQPDIDGFVSEAHAAGVKAILGIMDDSDDSAITTCTDVSHVVQFTTAITTFIAANHYDGVDIDWENGTVAPQYRSLITSLRSAAPTIHISVPVSIVERSTMAPVQAQLDQINLMAYELGIGNFNGQLLTHTWYNSPTLQGVTDLLGDEAMDAYLYYFITDAGIAAAKIGLSVGFFSKPQKGCLDAGKTHGVTDPLQVWISDHSTEYVTYAQLLASPYWAGVHVWDDLHKSQYIRYVGGSCATDTFAPYTGVEQVVEIVRLAKQYGIGGMMAFKLNYEFLPSQSGNAQYPLSFAIVGALRGTAAGGPAVQTGVWQ